MGEFHNNSTPDSREFINLIKDVKVPAIKDSNDKIIFANDCENKRVVLNALYFELLFKRNQLQEYISYLKDNTSIEYITLFTEMQNKVSMINLFIKEQKIYYVPMNYDDDNSNEINDDNIHYTEKAVKVKNESEGKTDKISEGKKMKFVSVKNPQSKNEFLPLFKSKEELRTIFKKDKYRIAMITYEEAAVFAKEFSGIVFRPTVESFIIYNEKTQFFTAIDEFIKPVVDYRKYTSKEKSIQDKITKLQSMKNGTDDFNSYYRGILQNIADMDNIYIALSPDSLDLEKGCSIPLVHNVNNHKGFYIFSELEIAEKWCEHYKNYSPDGKMLIGSLNRKNDFDSLYAIASRMGINLCMIDEGEAAIGFSINVFMDINNLSHEITLRMPENKADKIIKNTDNTIDIRFNKIKVINMNGDNEENFELHLK